VSGRRRRIPGVHVVAEVPSFESVAERHLDDVHAYLVYLTRDRAVAEDLTAETFEKAFRQWRRFDPRRGSARTWLCQLARTIALDHFRAEERRRRREGAYAADRSEHAEDGLFGGLSPALERALATLSAGEREVIALRVLLDLDIETAALVLGISPTACTTRLSRALKKLEERMGEDVAA
jgi:RNA polymerase sigma-70 factor, ECF subfamily